MPELLEPNRLYEDNKFIPKKWKNAIDYNNPILPDKLEKINGKSNNNKGSSSNTKENSISNTTTNNITLNNNNSLNISTNTDIV